LGYTDFSVIETVQHLLGGFAPFAGGEITEALLGRSTQWNARQETADEAVVTGREKALERKPGRSFALLRSKGWGERLDPVEPQERRPDEISWPGLRAE
jgi:hypothetical protein